MNDPIVIPATHKMYAALVDEKVLPEDEIRPLLVIGWALYRSDYDDFDEPNPVTINGELARNAEGLAVHMAEDRSNLLKMVRRIAENNAKEPK